MVCRLGGGMSVIQGSLLLAATLVLFKPEEKGKMLTQVLPCPARFFIVFIDALNNGVGTEVPPILRHGPILQSHKQCANLLKTLLVWRNVNGQHLVVT